MSFFSLVELAAGVQPMNRELHVLSRSGEAYRDHQLLWRLFRDRVTADGVAPEEEAADPSVARDFIFRRRTEISSTLSYYVVSRREPKPALGLLKVTAKPYHPHLQIGDRVAFDLRANPVVSRTCKLDIDGSGKHAGSTRSRHHDVLMDAKLAARSAGRRAPDALELDAHDPILTWLATRAQAWGLTPHLDTVIQGAPARNRLHPRGREIVFTSIDLSGFAVVTDPRLLHTALLEGVGKKRGFGCGLLLVRRAG